MKTTGVSRGSTEVVGINGVFFIMLAIGLIGMKYWPLMTILYHPQVHNLTINTQTFYRSQVLVRHNMYLLFEIIEFFILHGLFVIVLVKVYLLFAYNRILWNIFGIN